MIFNNKHKASKQNISIKIYYGLKKEGFITNSYHNIDDFENVVTDILSDYHIYKPQIKQGKNVWFRLLIPFWFIIALFMLIVVLPIKWLITGKYHLNIKNTGFSYFLINWTRNTFNNFD